MKIEKYTFGIGDRFAHEGRAQLQAVLKARAVGIDVHPVWNKSNREHLIIKSSPNDVRAEADSAVVGVLRGKAAKMKNAKTFLKGASRYVGSLSIPGIDRPFHLSEETVRGAA